VVVAVRDAEPYLERCIAALSNQIPPDGGYEVIVVDDGSRDSSAAIAGNAPKVRLLSTPGHGPYAARNRAVEQAEGVVIAFTDADCVPDSDWLRKIVAEFEDPEALIVVGSRAPAGSSKPLALIAAYEETKDETVFASGDLDVIYGSCNNLGVRRSVLERAGGFLERERGADAAFVNGVARNLSPNGVRYRSAIRVVHLEIDRVLAYYRKAFLYARSMRRLRAVSRVRPVPTRMRLEIWRRTVRDRRLSPLEAAQLLVLLVLGAAFWTAGTVSAILSRGMT
jgi:glycosyltransferase involved in cell wall biosynthesis